MGIAVIIMGSRADLEWAERIESVLNEFRVDVVKRIASAHKTPERCMQIIREYENRNVVFITIAGRSNALGGFVDAQTTAPVITCPPYSDTFSGADIFSSLRMPSGVAPMVVLEPAGAALAAAKIIAMNDSSVKKAVVAYQEKARQKILQDDREVCSGKC